TVVHYFAEAEVGLPDPIAIHCAGGNQIDCGSGAGEIAAKRQPGRRIRQRVLSAKLRSGQALESRGDIDAKQQRGSDLTFHLRLERRPDVAELLRARIAAAAE